LFYACCKNRHKTYNKKITRKKGETGEEDINTEISVKERKRNDISRERKDKKGGMENVKARWKEK
jgi:hypothetical protein